MLEYNKGKCADKAERSRVMVIRTQYLERLRPFYDSELVKVITGIRRCGKSTILRQVIAEIKENVLTKRKGAGLWLSEHSIWSVCARFMIRSW